MSRRRRTFKRRSVSDPIYHSPTLAKFINKLMIGGKKSVARKILYDAIEKFANRIKTEEALASFEQALENAKPALEVKSRRIGGATYQVPIEVRPNRKQSLALRWLRDYSRDRAGKNMVEKLADEIIDAANNRGGAVKKREDVYKMAEANKAFAHLKW